MSEHLQERMADFFAKHDAQHNKEIMTQLQNVVVSADPIFLLSTAEAAGNRDVALTNIISALGYGAGQLNGTQQTALRSLIYDRLISLRPIAQANYYNFYL